MDGGQPQEQGDPLTKAVTIQQPPVLHAHKPAMSSSQNTFLALHESKHSNEPTKSGTSPAWFDQGVSPSQPEQGETGSSRTGTDRLKEQDQWAMGLPKEHGAQGNISCSAAGDDAIECASKVRKDVVTKTVIVNGEQNPPDSDKPQAISHPSGAPLLERSQHIATAASLPQLPGKSVPTSTKPPASKIAQAFGATVSSSPWQWDTWTPEMSAEPLEIEADPEIELTKSLPESPAGYAAHVPELPELPELHSQMKFDALGLEKRISEVEEPASLPDTPGPPAKQNQSAQATDNLSALKSSGMSLLSPSTMEQNPSNSRDPSTFSKSSSIWSSDTTFTTASSVSALPPSGSVRRKPIGSAMPSSRSYSQQSPMHEDKMATYHSQAMKPSPVDLANEKELNQSPDLVSDKEIVSGPYKPQNSISGHDAPSSRHLSSYPAKSSSAPIVVTTKSIGSGVDKVDLEGFPSLVRSARDGNGEMVERLLARGAQKDVVHAKTKRSALIEASENGHLKIVELLLDYGCSIQHLDHGGMAALHYAAQKGYLLVAKALLDRSADVNICGPNGLTPVYLACWAPHANMVMLLLQRHADVNARDAWQRTALHVAASRGFTSICNILLDHGAQVESRDGDFKTPILLSIGVQHIETVELLLARSSLHPTNASFLAALFASIQTGNIRMVDSFFKRGATFKGLKDEAYKPITSAAKSGNPAMIDLVIRNKAKIKEKDSNGWTALHYAAHHGHASVIERLGDKEIATNCITSEKQTPLHLAVQASNFAAADAILRGKGISCINTKNVLGQEPLHQAVRIGNMDIVNLLISNKSNLSADNGFGWKPLHIAVAYGHASIVIQLITMGASLEDRLTSTHLNKSQTHSYVESGYWAEAHWSFPGSKPLHLAVEFGQDDIARYLISRGAKIDSACSEGWRPLHLAAFNSSPAMVEHLLSLGAYPHAVTDTLHHRTALDIAKYRAQSPFLPNVGKTSYSPPDNLHVQRLLIKAISFTPKNPQEVWMKQMKVIAGKGPEEKIEHLRAAAVAGDVSGLKIQMAGQKPGRR